MKCCASVRATGTYFGPEMAERDLARYRRKGPGRITRRLLAGLERAGLGATVLDIGAGIGALSFELLEAGVERATLVELSSAYLEAARREADRRSCGGRVRMVAGDFVVVAAEIEPADIVALDRVVCCYPEYAPLLRQAAARCRACLALSWPRECWYVRLVTQVQNFKRRRRGSAFQTFVHPARGMDTVLAQEGLTLVSRRRSVVWCVDVYMRGDAGEPLVEVVAA